MCLLVARLLFNSSVVGIRSLQPNLVSFNAAISACEAAGEWQVALCLLACITVSSHKADLLTYNSVISALGRGEQWQLALLFLHGYLPQAGLTPDVFSFTAAISAMEKAANGDQALALLACAKRILPEGPNMVLYSAVISGLWKEQAMARGSGIVVRSTWRSFCKHLWLHTIQPSVHVRRALSGRPPFYCCFSWMTCCCSRTLSLAVLPSVPAKAAVTWEIALILFTSFTRANFTRCNHIWLYHSCLWKGQSLARSILAVSVHAGRRLETRHYHLQRLDQLMLHVCSVDCGHGMLWQTLQDLLLQASVAWRHRAIQSQLF